MRNAGRNTAPTAPAGQAGSPHAGIAPAHERWPAERAKIAKLDRAVRSSLSPAFRTQMDFAACSMSQGVVATADFTPFVRTVARTCTWTVRPLHRRQPCRREDQRSILLHSKARHRCGHLLPAPRCNDDRNTPLSVRDAKMIPPAHTKFCQ